MYGILPDSYIVLSNVKNTFVKSNRLCENFVKNFSFYN